LIFNIDQTGIFFENPRKITLAHRGATQAPILTDKLSVRATMVLAETMDGRKLKPYVVLKGAHGPRSRITRTFNALPDGLEYSIQPNAWVDKQKMAKYIVLILGPHMLAYPGWRGLLILDGFSAHISKDIQIQLRSAGFDLLYVLKGMTGFLQPLDIGINKPFKDRLKTYYTEWLTSIVDMDSEGYRRPRPTRELIASWIQ
jgi:hypothetical protein